MMKDYYDVLLKCYVWLSADVFQKFRNNSWKNLDNVQISKWAH